MHNNQFNVKRKRCPEKRCMCSVYSSHFVSVFVCLEFIGYSSLNALGTYKLIWSGTMRRYDFVGVDMVLLEDVHHCRGGL